VAEMGLCLREGLKLRYNELSPQRIEDGVPVTKTTLKPYDSVSSHLQAHASLSVEGTLTAESGFSFRIRQYIFQIDTPE
jgi:hypothetical protein